MWNHENILDFKNKYSFHRGGNKDSLNYLQSQIFSEMNMNETQTPSESGGH